MIVISNRKLYVGIFESKHLKPAGVLKLTRDGVVENGEFAYGIKYLEDAQSTALNEEHLPLKKQVATFPPKRVRDGGALPLTFKDALPDTWGRKVLEIEHGKALDDVDVLLLTNQDRIGAMVFSESLNFEMDEPLEELPSLNEISEAVSRLSLSLEVTPRMKRLLRPAGSLGGARPKDTFVEDGYRWIAKFPALGDLHDMELLEYVCLKTAEMAGITIPELKLVKLSSGHALLVKRFDCVGPISNETRVHYLSASAILNAAYESNEGSYYEFSQALRKISSDTKADLLQLMKRLLFNLLIDNTDDHVKNHGVLQTGDGKYRLSPAFDVVMQMRNIGYQELAIKPKSNQSKISLAREIAPYFGLSDNEFTEILNLISNCINANFMRLLVESEASKKLIDDASKCLRKQREIVFS